MERKTHKAAVEYGLVQAMKITKPSGIQEMRSQTKWPR